MAKMQNISFGSIGEFLDYLPDDERKIVNILRKIITDSIPNIQEKLSYNVPYFSKYYRICFIWPASVPWGATPINGVQLGFCYGNLLQDDSDYLEKGTRKQVYIKTFHSVQDIDEALIRSFLYDAMAIDEALQQEKLAKAAKKRKQSQ